MGPIEIAIFVGIAFVLPLIIIVMDDNTWQRAKNPGDLQTRSDH